MDISAQDVGMASGAGGQQGRAGRATLASTQKVAVASRCSFSHDLPSTEPRGKGRGGTGMPVTSKISCGKCVGNLNDANMEKNGRLGQKYELPCHLKTFGNRGRASSGA